MTDFGTWLELYCYISLHDCGVYNDVRLSVKVDWDGERKSRPEVTNEIDVTFFRGVHPVFLSCKLAEPAPEALHELSVYKSYFGGGYSKCILATLSAIDRENTHIGKRAQEMDIALIDATDIREGRFLQRVAELF